MPFVPDNRASAAELRQFSTDLKSDDPAPAEEV